MVPPVAVAQVVRVRPADIPAHLVVPPVVHPVAVQGHLAVVPVRLVVVRRPPARPVVALVVRLVGRRRRRGAYRTRLKRAR